MERELLKNFYWKEGLSLKQICKKLEVPYSTLHYWMRKHKILRRKFKTVPIPKEFLFDLYVNKKLNTKQIAEKFNCCEETIRKKLIKFGIPRRSNSESKTKYPKRNFSGNFVEKAYMIGLRMGDLYARRNHSLIRLKTSTTHLLLLENLMNTFGKYGHIMIDILPNKGLWELHVDID